MNVIELPYEFIVFCDEPCVSPVNCIVVNLEEDSVTYVYLAPKSECYLFSISVVVHPALFLIRG